MRYLALGDSGCAVSELCLGTMTFGAEAAEQEAHAQLDRFLEAGGNLVDTADVYSVGVSEEIIGRWLAARPRSMEVRLDDEEVAGLDEASDLRATDYPYGPPAPDQRGRELTGT